MFDEGRNTKDYKRSGYILREDYDGTLRVTQKRNNGVTLRVSDRVFYMKKDSLTIGVSRSLNINGLKSN